MYSVSSAMSMDNFSVVQPSTSQATYTAGQILRFILPRNLGFFDAGNSFLELEVELKDNNYPMTFSNDCGANMLIEFIKISQNGVQIEQIDRYNNLAQLYKCYGETFNERQRHTNKDLSRVSNSSQSSTFKTGNAKNPTFASRLGGAGNSAANFAMTKKVYVDLNITGLFSMSSLVPLVALGDLEIEIRFAPDKEVLIVDPNVKANHKIVGQVGAGTNSITLDKDYAGFLNLGTSPFVVGQKIDLVDPPSTVRDAGKAITAISEDKDGTITLTTETLTNGNATGSDNFIQIKTGTDGVAAPTSSASYVINKANMYLHIVRPPQQYMAALSKQVSGGGLTLDMHTWTCYKNVVKKALPSQTLEIPCYAMRSKAVLTILNEMGQTTSYRVDNTQDHDANGEYEDLETYQYQDGSGHRMPTRPVDVSSLAQDFPKPPAQHHHELSKALMGSNVPYNSFKRVLENFVVGRTFGRYGSTSNLSQQGGLRIYLDYTASTKPSKDLQSFSWCNHINRVVVGNAGLQVFS
ncbi:MAG TPA: hypothetical protein DCM40_09990 [Maribacter sp.]|nr:hypothetical protein [Maribacter sp.]